MKKTVLRKKKDIVITNRKYESPKEFLRIRLSREDLEIVRNSLSEIIRNRFPDSEAEQRMYYSLSARKQEDIEKIFEKVCGKLDRINLKNPTFKSRK